MQKGKLEITNNKLSSPQTNSIKNQHFSSKYVNKGYGKKQRKKETDCS